MRVQTLRFMDHEPRLERNDERQRYELWDGDDRVGTLKIREDPDATVLVETFVDPKFEGHGYGSRLVSAALAEVRASGKKLRIECSFARAYVERHPDEVEGLLLEQG